MDTSKKIPNLELVQDLLTRLSNSYPKKIDSFSLFRWWKPEYKDYIYKNLCYLEEMGLVEMCCHDVLGYSKCSKIKITANGLNYLHPNGGLAPLTAPYIRVPHDELRKIASDALQERKDISSEDKSRLSRIIATANDQMLRDVVSTILKKGIEWLPQISDLFKNIS